ncbi:Cyclic nucleotide-gated cation channel beta-1 [Balamuthia mandrillaris]
MKTSATIGVGKLVSSSPLIEGWVEGQLSSKSGGRREPSLEELVLVKIILRIPDQCWPLVMHTFHLSKNATLHQVKKKLSEMLSNGEEALPCGSISCSGPEDAGCFDIAVFGVMKQQLESQVNAEGKVVFLSSEDTKFRTLEGIETLWRKISCKKRKKSTRLSQASQHNGQVSAPILLFDPKQVIPCLLHLVMAICCKLLNKTIELVWIDRKGWLADLLTQRLEKMGIHLVSDQKKGCTTFAQRVKKSHFNRREFLIVLEHAEEWLSGLEEDKESDEISKEEVREEKQKEEEDKEEEEKEKEEEERKEPYKTVEGHLQRVRTVWRTFHRVCTLAMQENVCITEERWKEEACKFLFAFLNVWPATNITTYIHIFVDHLGYWLEKEGCVEMFSNFSIESTHNTLKRMVRESTQGFSGKNTGECLLPKQLLEKRSLETTAAAESPVVAAVLKSKSRANLE